MNHSKIHVQYRDGSKAAGVRVVLSFGCLGVSKPAFTDHYGVAIVKHAATGQANVIVKGSTRGTVRAPGETVVFV
ncbi:MAG: hypothetical protein AAFX06_22495 [Planctomycetota bacterium]